MIYWMFGIIDRTTKNARVFFTLNNRVKKAYYHLYINNIITDKTEEHNLSED